MPAEEVYDADADPDGLLEGLDEEGAPPRPEEADGLELTEIRTAGVEEAKGGDDAADAADVTDDAADDAEPPGEAERVAARAPIDYDGAARVAHDVPRQARRLRRSRRAKRE